MFFIDIKRKEGRYKAIIVQKEFYLLGLSRYIVLNPVRAQMVRSAMDWPWSSYKAAAGFINADKWLTVNWILSTFARKNIDAVILYRSFVSE